MSIFKEIIEICEYKSILIDEGHKFFLNKEFIKNNIVRKWLFKILEDLIKPEYDEFNEKVGSSLKTFYTRNATIENIKGKKNGSLRRIRFKKNKDIKEIFPLNLEG